MGMDYHTKVNRVSAISHKFVAFYFNTLGSNHFASLINLYSPNASCSHTLLDGETKTYLGSEFIVDVLKYYYHVMISSSVNIISIRSHPSLNDSILINVLVEFNNKESNRNLVLFTFILIENEYKEVKSFLIINQMIQHLDDKLFTMEIEKKKEFKEEEINEEDQKVIDEILKNDLKEEEEEKNKPKTWANIAKMAKPLIQPQPQPQPSNEIKNENENQQKRERTPKKSYDQHKKPSSDHYKKTGSSKGGYRGGRRGGRN